VFSKLIKSLYLQVIITIVVEQTYTLVEAEVYSRKKLLKSERKSFETTSLNDEIYQFISHYMAQSPYYYIALLDPSDHQFALYGCAKSEYKSFIDVDECEIVCYENKWGVCTHKNEIMTLQKQYEGVGIDLLFSPVIVLRKFFDDKIKGALGMYVLVEESRLTLAIFEHEVLLYAKQLTLVKTNDSDVDELFVHDDEDEIETLLDEDIDDGIDLEDINVGDEIEDLEDFGNIEDLESLEDIDDFSDDKTEDFDSLQEESEEVQPSQTREDDFNEEFQRFSFIETSVKEYYEDDRYESEFLENVYIADSVGVNSDLKRYLEEEMFFNVYIRQIDILKSVSGLVKEELGI
jgi:hypothetical protein